MTNQISDHRCQFLRAEGNRCRTPRKEGHSSLCPHHARQAALSAQTSDLENPNSSIAPELLGPVHDFRSAASVNHVLGKLLILVAGDRVPPRNAAVIAYICQLLLQSLSEVKSELYDVENATSLISPEVLKEVKLILKADSPAHTAKSQSLLAGVSRVTN